MSTRADRVSLNWDGFDYEGYRYMTQGVANVNGRRKVQLHVFEQNDDGHYRFEHNVYVPVPGNTVTINKDKLISLVWQRIRELAEDNYAA
jgi:hypothetical protein